MVLESHLSFQLAEHQGQSVDILLNAQQESYGRYLLLEHVVKKERMTITKQVLNKDNNKITRA